MSHSTISYPPRVVALRVDGGPNMGMGHVVRQVTLARTLHNRFNWKVVFLSTTPECIRSRCNATDAFSIEALPGIESDGSEEAEALSRLGADLLLCDLKRPLDAGFVQTVHHTGRPVWLYGNSGDGCHHADMNIFAFPHVARRLIPGHAGLRSLESADNAILAPEFAWLRRNSHPRQANPALRVFVSMGGTDQPFLTGRIIQALCDMNRPLELICVTGDAFEHERALSDLLSTARFPWHVYRQPSHFARLAAHCDLALTQMGNTVAEMNCLGVPVLTLNSTPFHHHVASLYGADGALGNLGLSDALDDNALAQALARWFDDPQGRRALGMAGRATVDGQGAARVAQALFDALQPGFQQMPCDICGADSPAPLAVINARPLARCEECDFEYMNIRPTAEHMGTVYGHGYFTSPRTQGDAATYEADKENVLRFARARLDTLDRLLPSRGKLLDVGCALGFYLEEARTRGWQTSGMDISTYAVEYARNTLGLDDVRQGTVENLDYPHEHFDAIVCSLVFEHFLAPRACLAKMAAWLRPGGYIALKVPHADGVMRRHLAARWFATHPDNHFCDYTRHSLGRLLQDFGFWPEECVTEGIYLERLADAIGMDETQRTALLNIPGLQETWKQTASRDFLGDSLVLFGRKL